MSETLPFELFFFLTLTGYTVFHYFCSRIIQTASNLRPNPVASRRTDEEAQPNLQQAVAHRPLARAAHPASSSSSRFFYFYIFYFCFLQKYIFELEIYRNIPGRPAAGTWPPGCRAVGANLQKKEETKLQPGPWEPAAQ